MAKPKVVLLKGLPGSGKSTLAKKLVENFGWVRTNKDDLREMLFAGHYKKKDEKTVLRIRDRIIEDALSHNKSVVVDDTNLNPIHAKDIEKIAKKYSAEFTIDDSLLSVPIEVCVARDLKRLKSVGESAIRDMYAQWIQVPAEATPFDPDLPTAVIIDIDGTLAHTNGKRGIFDLSKVSVDDADDAVSHIVDCINCVGYADVFIFSGRDDICRADTEEWLDRNDIQYKSLYMRPHARKNEDDRDIKRDMYKDNIQGKYNVLFIVDDRPKVCRMWREEFGFRVLQVGDPYKNF